MIELSTILSGAWSLFKGICLEVGGNELHRQLVERFERAGDADLDLQKALYASLCDAVDSLGKTLSTENHPHFQSIPDFKERHDEQQRVKKIFRTIRAQFPAVSALKSPVTIILDDKAQIEVKALLVRLGLKSYLASLQESLHSAFESNLPFVMLTHFRRQVATDDRLHALLQLDITTAGFQAVQRELRAISNFLRQRCGNDDPAQIQIWTENLAGELKSFMSGEFKEIKERLGNIETKFDKLYSLFTEIHDRQAFQHLSAGFIIPQLLVEKRSAVAPTASMTPALPPRIEALSGFDSMGGKLFEEDGSLPYHQLGGKGLERLCYLLLLADGKVPRYFGKPGQEQYGIDLLVTHGDECMVYQCKNEESFPLSKMKDALRHFEEEWLGRPELPKPNQFVLCCPLPLQERKQNEMWTELERQFYERTHVSVEFWDRHYLDEHLRRLPDVVADLFSDRAAERFCNLDDWNSGLFRPVTTGSGERNIERYLEKKAAGEVYLNPELVKDFAKKLKRSSNLLIHGLPGSGKTITGLALAESFADNRYRLFYISLKHDISEDTLVTGIRRRLAQPTIFLLDDCHGKFEMLDLVQYCLSTEMRGKGFLVFMARTTPTPKGILRGGDSNFEESLEEAEATLELRPTLIDFREIIALAKPHFTGLSKLRLQKIFDFTGHDIFLLDQLLDTIDSPNEIDQLKREKVFEKTLKRYFRKSLGDRPEFMKLAALAQFDIAPPVSYFHSDLDKQDEDAATQLVVRADLRPSRYFFLHSSAAELICRAMAWNSERDDYPELAASHLIEYFKNCEENAKRLAVALSNVIRNRLKLTSNRNEKNRLRSQFLANDGIYAFVKEVFDQLPLDLMAVCLIILKNMDAATFGRYRDLVQRKIDDGTALNMVIACAFRESTLFLSLAKKDYPLLLSDLRSQLVDRGLRALIKTTEFQNFLMLIANLSEPKDSWWSTALDSIPDDELDDIIRRTIDSRRSIGSIDRALRELKKNNSALLEKLERKIGAKRYLHLITSIGTITELFKVIKDSSPSMARELINALNAENMGALIDKAITSGHSIGTIHLALRELKKDPTLLEKLEHKIGAKRWWQLICANGTIRILTKLFDYMDKSYKQELAQYSQNLSLAQWQELLLRGDFADLGHFINWYSLSFSKQFTAAFVSSLKPTFETLIRRDGWEARNRGAGLLRKPRDFPIKKHLLDLLHDYLATVDLESLRFNFIGEAIHCVHLLWQELPSRRKELADSLMTILSKEKAWYADVQFLRSAHLLFFILSNPQAGPDNARCVLSIGNSKEVVVLCAEAKTLELFLYLWNFYGLWFEWQREGEKAFVTFLNSEIRDTVSNVLAKRLQTHASQDEKDNQIALAGLLSFLGLAVSSAEKAGWLLSLPSFNDLVKRVQPKPKPEPKTFIPEFFFLLGLEWIFDRKNGVSQQTWQRLLTKAEAYTEKPAALKHLRDFVRARAELKK